MDVSLGASVWGGRLLNSRAITEWQVELAQYREHSSRSRVVAYRKSESEMFTQLNPPLPVIVLEKGPGLAFAVIDYGMEHNLIWVTALDATGEIWCAPNPKVRLQANWSMGRTKDERVSIIPEGVCAQ